MTALRIAEPLQRALPDWRRGHWFPLRRHRRVLCPVLCRAGQCWRSTSLRAAD